MKDSLRFDIYFVASNKESSFNYLVNKDAKNFSMSIG